MIKPIIVTFSGQARHGKSVSAEILGELLTEKGFRVMIAAYSDYMQFLLKQYKGWDGKKDENGRALLNYIGSEIGRAKNPDFWVNNLVQLIELWQNDYDFILISGCRFENEITRWQDEGYRVFPIHVERLNFVSELTEDQKKHPSENSLKTFCFTRSLKAENLHDLKTELKNKVLPLITE